MEIKRIVVLGTSGSGKTTLARNVAERYGIKHIELDLLFWKPGWATAAIPEFTQEIKKAIAENESWVICGNYDEAKRLTLPIATDIIWLNYPLYVNLWRALKRSIKRIITKEESFPGCPETFAHLFFSKQSILLWVLKTQRLRQTELSKLLTKENFPNATISIVRNSDEYNAVVGIKSAVGSAPQARPLN